MIYSIGQVLAARWSETYRNHDKETHFDKCVEITHDGGDKEMPCCKGDDETLHGMSCR